MGNEVRSKCYNVDCSDHDETEPKGCHFSASVDTCIGFVSKEKWQMKMKELGLPEEKEEKEMDNVKAAYTLIITEAKRRSEVHPLRRKISCRKLRRKVTEVGQEVDRKLFAYMVEIEEKERKEKKKKGK